MIDQRELARTVRALDKALDKTGRAAFARPLPTVIVQRARDFLCALQRLEKVPDAVYADSDEQSVQGAGLP